MGLWWSFNLGPPKLNGTPAIDTILNDWWPARKSRCMTYVVWEWTSMARGSSQAAPARISIREAEHGVSKGVHSATPENELRHRTILGIANSFREDGIPLLPTFCSA